MSSKEFAQVFECTPAYITVIEKDDRVMKRKTLGYVLNKLTITMNQYDELDEFYQNILEEASEEEFTKLMLFKAYSVISKIEEEKTQIEAVINIILKNNKARK